MNHKKETTPIFTKLSKGAVVRRLALSLAAGALTGILFLTPSYAATEKPSEAPVAAPQEITVSLTALEIQAVKRALELAAGTCSTQLDGCAIGSYRNTLDVKLDAALKTPK